MSIEKIAEKFESVVDYNTKLENFDGPLDLLLYLVKQSEIEIKDIFVFFNMNNCAFTHT